MAGEKVKLVVSIDSGGDEFWMVASMTIDDMPALAEVGPRESYDRACERAKGTAEKAFDAARRAATGGTRNADPPS
jgi:hypothetical protein